MRYLCTFLICSFFSTAALAQKTGADKVSPNPVFGFLENKGQITDEHGKVRNDVRFSTHANNVHVFVLEDGLQYQISSTIAQEQIQEVEDNFKRPQPSTLAIHSIKLQLLNANTDAAILREFPLTYIENYYLPQCRDGLKGVQSFEKITFQNIYPNIDWVLYRSENNMKYDFVVRPGGDVMQIKFNIEGATETEITKDGGLILKNKLGVITEAAPVSFSQAGETLQSKFILKNNQLSFEVAPCETTFTVDPSVSWITYYGGSDDEFMGGLTYNSKHEMLITGSTSSTNNIAFNGLVDTITGLQDAFIAKFDTSGTRIGATYFGGSKMDYTRSIAITKNDGYVVYGHADSDSLFKNSPYQRENQGAGDLFLIKFDANDNLIWGTYYGGDRTEYNGTVAVDGSNNIAVTGRTNSQIKIATSNAHVTQFGGLMDGFIAKFSANGNLLWATYTGGDKYEQLDHVATDKLGNVFVVGYSRISAGLATTGAYQTANAGMDDGLIQKYSPIGSLLWSTYYGGAKSDLATACAINSKQELVVTGTTNSASGISSSNSIQQPTKGAGTDCFIATFGNGGNLRWASYFGGNGNDAAYTSIAIDAVDNVYFSGFTDSDYIDYKGFSINPWDTYTHFVAKFLDYGLLQWSSKLDVSLRYQNASIMVLPSHKIMVGLEGYYTGDTTKLVGQKTFGGGTDCLILLIDDCAKEQIDSIEACKAYTWPATGKKYYTSGEYQRKLGVTPDACDSLAILRLVINPDTSVTRITGGLKSNAKNATYQWLDCSLMQSPIVGATDSIYNPTYNGVFAVVINKNGCIDTSACTVFRNIGLDEHPEPIFSVFPNPTKNTVHVQLKEGYTSAILNLYNNIGQKISTETITTAQSTTITLTGSAGVYFLECSTSQGAKYVIKLLKE